MILDKKKSFGNNWNLTKCPCPEALWGGTPRERVRGLSSKSLLKGPIFCNPPLEHQIDGESLRSLFSVFMFAQLCMDLHVWVVMVVIETLCTQMGIIQKVGGSVAPDIGEWQMLVLWRAGGNGRPRWDKHGRGARRRGPTHNCPIKKRLQGFGTTSRVSTTTDRGIWKPKIL